MTRVSSTKDEIIYFLFNSSIMQSNICKKMSTSKRFFKILTPQAQLSLHKGQSVFERTLKCFEQSPMSEKRECKVQDQLSYGVNHFWKFFFGCVETLIITNFENFSCENFSYLRTVRGDEFIWKSFYHLSILSV